MQQLTDSAIRELTKRNKFIIPVIEIYPRTTEDISSISAPSQAIGRFSNVCFDWVNSTGSYHYDAKILEFGDIFSYLSDQVNTAEIKFSNAQRGEGSMSRFVLNNHVKGCWMVIRLVFPDSPEDSVILFWGKCQRPGEIDNMSLTISAAQDIGDSAQQIPFRTYTANCPLDFARPLGGCLGNEALTDKSVSFQAAVAQFGTSGCNKLFSTCVLLDNTKFFQGQRVVAVSGQFSYITVEEVVKRVLFWTTRKKVQTVHNDTWSSVNQSEDKSIVPLAFGRCQIQGHPITWADVGSQVRTLFGFSEGKVSEFTFVRSRTEGINIVSQVTHLGEYGGVGTQGVDSLFNGVSGYNSRLAYLEIITDGSSPTQVDDAPIVTAVIRGLEVPLPGPTGEYTVEGWTNNPVHATRFILTDTRFGKIPAYRLDDEYNLITAADCDSLVEDRTNDEAVVLPSNEFDNYGIGYRRFRSEGRYTAYKDMYTRGELQEVDPEVPEFEEPLIQWFDPFQPYIYPPNQVVLRQKYTFNGALQENTTVLDFLSKRVFPTFKGYINYGFNGKIQIKNRTKADNGYLRMDTVYLDQKIPVSDIAPWRGNYDGYLLVGVSLETAEIREVVGLEYSTACNGMPITATSVGGVTATTSTTLEGGNASSPGLGYITLDGTVSAGDVVEITFNTDSDAFSVSYIADGIEDVPTFARMLMAFLNANLQFTSYLTAYILPSDPFTIWVRCEAGYLILNKPLEYPHAQAEEVMRVRGVFENCGELTANSSAQFDNIIEETFKWNSAVQDDINAVIATYTSAIDDFHLTKISPRAAWDTIDLEGALVTKELDLTFVDNYWQAAFIAKGDAIDNIDGNLFASLSSDMLSSRYELGDVVAVRHDSGDGALNYVPFWIYSLAPDLNKMQTAVGLRLYLSASYDLHVQPIDVLLTTTLNPTLRPEITPDPTGTGGGISQSPEPIIVRPGHGYYEQFGISKYSPDGLDRT